MAICEYCGATINDSLTICPNCGAPVTGHISSTLSGTYGAGDYKIVLVSLGTCTRAAASDLLEDTLGYAPVETESLFNSLPAMAAQNLSLVQAQAVARAMTEYGMEVSIRNASGYVDLDDGSSESVFGSDGSFISKAAAVIATITAVNRMLKFRRWQMAGYDRHLYRPGYRPPRRPPHVRRRIPHGGIPAVKPEIRPQFGGRDIHDNIRAPQRPARNVGAGPDRNAVRNTDIYPSQGGRQAGGPQGGHRAGGPQGGRQAGGPQGGHRAGGPQGGHH